MLNIITKRVVGFFIALFITTITYSQQEALMGRVNIASPTASSIGKYGDIPVSYHTGVPNISIPVHTLSSGSLQLPISLSYHAGGLRLEENDSWVGAGWTLNAGGVITRTVKDKPDEKQTGSLNQMHGYFSDYGFVGATKDQYTGAIAYPETIDKEPDLFSFSFNGYSGKFYFNDDRTPLIVPEQDIKIEYNYTPGIWNGSPGLWSGNGRCIEGFKLTTPDGTKYYFGINPLSAIVAPYCDPVEVTSTYASTTGSNYSQVITSWFLYRIESVDGTQTITLAYERDKFAYYTYVNNLNYNNTDNNNTYTLVKNYVAGVRLSRIVSATGSVEFIEGSTRQDLSGWNPTDITQLNEYANATSKTLGSIQIKNTQGGIVKKLLFNYSYFSDNTNALPTFFQGWGIEYDKKRLKLLSVQEQSADGSVNNPPYSFDYFNEPVVRRLSFAKDHWGYNNGATSNAGLYPELYLNNGLTINGGIGIAPANRDAAWPAMRGGSLSKITYPTGGYTSFDFEQHKFYVLENNVNVEKNIGGLRIKSITNYDPLSNKSNITNYSYVEGNGTLSSGILFSKPTYIQIYRNDWMKRSKHWGLSNGNGCMFPADATTIHNWPYLFSDNPLRPMETTQGYHIGYKEVKLSQVNNGYSIFRFYTGPTWPLPDRSGIAVNKINYPGPCDANIPNLPAAPPVHDFKRGEMVYEGRFNNDGQALVEKNILNTYVLNAITAPGLIHSTQYTVGMEETLYDIQTARLTESITQETIYQRPAGTSLTTQTQTFYESNYHLQPTKIVTTDSKGNTVEKKLKYAFDYRVPIFENTTSCNNPVSSFLSYTNNLFDGTYATQFNDCVGANWSWTCYNSRWNSFNTTLFNARQSFINCRRTNYTNLYTPTTALNTFQVNHNTAKNNADAELKPILWMQDINLNAPIEVSEWKNGQLLSASYTRYSNIRDDEYGVYPEKFFKIDLQAPSSIFQISAVSSNGVSITRDSRYTEVSALDFNEGNIINALSRDGVVTSYGWGYNKALPVVKVTNASNKEKQILQPGPRTNSYTATISYGNCFNRQETFYHTSQGTITLAISSLLPPSASATVTYTLTGPNNYSQTGALCKESSGSGCSGYPTSISFANAPSGNYTITYSMCTPFQSYSFGAAFSYTYNGWFIVQSGLKEFFLANFEEGIDGVSGLAHTGTKYYNGNYPVSFSPSNLSTRAYKIQWWNWAGGKWNFNSQPYTGSVTLTGPVDDVRIFPTDAFMTSYTYDGSGKMLTETDHLGKSRYYYYDKMNRLNVIFDDDKNVIKRICYTISGQTEDCAVAVHTNDPQSGVFIRNNCSNGTGGSVTYTVPAGRYYSLLSKQEANEMAVADVTANGQAYANANGTCNESCSLTANSTINMVANSISNSGSSVSFYMVFYTYSTFNPYTSYWVATVNGPCRPSSTVSFNTSFAGRIWNIVIQPDGKMYFMIVSGSPYPPSSTNSTGTLTYNL